MHKKHVASNRTSTHATLAEKSNTSRGMITELYQVSPFFPRQNYWLIAFSITDGPTKLLGRDSWDPNFKLFHFKSERPENPRRQFLACLTVSVKNVSSLYLSFDVDKSALWARIIAPSQERQCCVLIMDIIDGLDMTNKSTSLREKMVL